MYLFPCPVDIDAVWRPDQLLFLLVFLVLQDPGGSEGHDEVGGWRVAGAPVKMRLELVGYCGVSGLPSRGLRYSVIT